MGGTGPAKHTLLRPPPWEKGGEPGTAASFGAWLRRQREAREVSLRDIAERTKISLRYLEAMEEDRFEILPAPVFAKGFLREYARYVGLSPDEVVNHYLSVQQPQAGDEGLFEVRPERRARRRWTSAAALGLAGLLLLGLLALIAFLNERWHARRAGSPGSSGSDIAGATPGGSLNSERRPSIVPPPPAAGQLSGALPAPASTGAAAAGPQPSAPLEVTVDFNQNCWVDVVVDGGSHLAELKVQGESMQLEAKESVVFAKLGNAPGVEIQVNGYPLDLDKTPGGVVKDLRIDLDTVRALKAKKERR
ncbi:MAG TPA: helix-turn-helix domain-containing protein [Thermoanaerobaculia bacterium]|nr:helix-turn-helix domain-containing protein [Thermoanaerobaculia bacterium]